MLREKPNPNQFEETIMPHPAYEFADAAGIVAWNEAGGITGGDAAYEAAARAAYNAAQTAGADLKTHLGYATLHGTATAAMGSGVDQYTAWTKARQTPTSMAFEAALKDAKDALPEAPDTFPHWMFEDHNK
jgi:hypothetical protein